MLSSCEWNFMEFHIHLFIFYHLAIWNFIYPDTVGLMARQEFVGNCVCIEDVQSSCNWTMQLFHYSNAVCGWNGSYRTNNSWQEIRMADPEVFQRLLLWFFQHKVVSQIVLCVAEHIYFHCFGVHCFLGCSFITGFHYKVTFMYLILAVSKLSFWSVFSYLSPAWGMLFDLLF